MYSPFEVFIGLRYLRARRRERFIAFISLLSISGIAVGVMALITILSVMNGFEKELTDRTLAMVSHATVERNGGPMTDWRQAATALEQQAGIVAVAPYLKADAMLVHGNRARAIALRGILPEPESRVSLLADRMQVGKLADLTRGRFGMFIGSELARGLGVSPGDVITLVVPRVNENMTMVAPRLRRFTIAGIFTAGMHEFDGALALARMEDVLLLLGQDSPTGLRLKTADVMQAPLLSRAALRALPDEYRVTDWTQRNAALWRALKTEKKVMFIILALVIAVAAFNIIASLVMVVTDKQADIAVLRTLGARSGSIMKIFMTQGAAVGIIGVILGTAGGTWLSLNIELIVSSLEWLLQAPLLSPDVYYVSTLPSDLQWPDVAATVVMALLFSLLGAVYPALRGARARPAEALRYE